ncbi:MAG: DUF5683 domain-containing protein [Alistipes sp.]
MKSWLKIVLLAAMMLMLCASAAQAQRYRGKKTIVRGGIMEKPDTTQLKADSLLKKTDSLGRAKVDSLKHSHTDSLDFSLIDSARLDSLRATPSLVRVDTTRRKGSWFMPDSMSLSKVCWISMVLPGYGQVYNKQYWKLPILYGALGAGLGLYFNESSKFRPLKREYEEMTALSTVRTPELDALQARMIRSNTRRQIYLGATIASYVFFIGDAAVNYSTNNVSNVKKATTLACIFPGAGQIYNKSYWKVPFVIGGFASMIYCIDWNNRGYQRFKKAYTLHAAYEKDPAAYPDGSADEFHGRYSSAFLKNLKDSYRRNRDLCIIISAALYVLQIVDAHVDAHLKDYDISDDLTMSIEPKVDYAFVPAAGKHQPTFGFDLSIKF